MNILITGNLSSLASAFATEFLKRKHRVVLASDDADKLGLRLKNLTTHLFNPASDIFRESMSAYRFDVVIFLAAREEQLSEQRDQQTGHLLDGLRNTLEMCRAQKPRHIFYVSSTEVYGRAPERCENDEPVPCSLNGHILATGEQYCKHYRDEYDLNVTIVRVPYVYGPHESNGLLRRLIQECKSQSTVVIPGKAHRLCNFLHANDIADLIKRAMEDASSPAAPVINLSSSKTITNSQLSELLGGIFPNTNFQFEEDAAIFTGPASASAAKKAYDWVDLHDLNTELANSLEPDDVAPITRQTGLRGLIQKYSQSTELLRPLELIFGAILTQYLSQLTGTLIQYKYVDFRLLFVVLMASIYGLRYGLLAALFMCLSLIYTWYQLEIDWNLLIFNVGNWFPPILYFVTGLILGYSHDRNETIIDNEKNQTRLIYEKYQFLYEVFNEIRKLKDEFREQVIGYRDSFGKIYSITRELDTLQEQDVYLKALNILEDLMQNDSIAIYRLEPDLEYARLEVSSTALQNKLAKSLKLSNYPEVAKSISRSAIFQNTALLPNYPAYLAPIFNNSYPFNVPVAIIVIWSVKFECYSTYYYNLFKVITGLIQASLVRATKFLDANYERIYVPATRILKPEAFNDVLQTRAEMNKNKVATDQLVIVENTDMPFEELYLRISQGIRAGDIVGLRADGNCYILLVQADHPVSQQVVTRLAKLGICCSLLEEQEKRMVEWHPIPPVAHPS